MKYPELIKIIREHGINLNRNPNARFRAMSYERVAQKLERFSEGKNTLVKLDKINKLDFTDYMKTRIADIIKNGKIIRQTTDDQKTDRKKEQKKEQKKDDIYNELVNLMGIGRERAKELIQSGVKRLSDLERDEYKKLLPTEAKLFLDLKPTTPIPHADIKAIEPFIKSVGKKIKSKIQLVGSYRRKRPTSSDIDVMVLSDDPDVLERFLIELGKKIKIYPYARGKDKISTLVENKTGTKKSVYKLDVFRTSTEDYIPMLLYSTGSKENNIEMRIKAKRAGYLLNQKGLFLNGVKVKGLNSEEDYFKILKMPYLRPEER